MTCNNYAETKLHIFMVAVSFPVIIVDNSLNSVDLHLHFKVQKI